MKRSVFLMITLFLSIATLPSIAQQEEDTKEAQQKAEEWLPLVDENDYSASWDEASPIFQQAISEDKWAETAKQVRSQVGDFESRNIQQAQYTTSLPNAPEGEYVVVQYESAFSNLENAIEIVVMNKTGDGEWAPIGYNIQPAQ